VYTLKCDDEQNDGNVIKKRSKVLATPIDSHGDTRFRRWEFWGYHSYYIVHYTGDENVYAPFVHKNSKKSRRHLLHLLKRRLVFNSIWFYAVSYYEKTFMLTMYSQLVVIILLSVV